MFVDWTGSINAALMLSQLAYWTPRKKPGEWIYKTAEDWEEELGLTQKQQRHARILLEESGLVEEKLMGVPAKLYFRINEREYLRRFDKRYNQDCTAGTDRHSPEVQTIPKTTPKTTNTTPARGGDRSIESTFGLSGKKTVVGYLAKRFADFSVKNNLHSGQNGAVSGGWTPKTIKQWERHLEEFLAMHDKEAFENLLDWYLDHWNDEYVPRAYTLPSFLRKYVQIVDAFGRANKNGRHRDEDAPPKWKATYAD